MKRIKRLCLIICIIGLSLRGFAVRATTETPEESGSETEETKDINAELEELLADQRFQAKLAQLLEREGEKIIRGHGSGKSDEESPYIRCGSVVQITETGVDFIVAVEENPDGAVLMVEIYAYDKDGEIVASDCVWAEGVTEVIGHAAYRWGDGYDVSRVVYYAKVYGGESGITHRLVEVAS